MDVFNVGTSLDKLKDGELFNIRIPDRAIRVYGSGVPARFFPESERSNVSVGHINRVGLKKQSKNNCLGWFFP